MTIEAARKKYTMFFYLLFGDERRVYAASIEAFHNLNSARSEITTMDFIQVSFRIHKKFKDKAKSNIFSEVQFVGKEQTVKMVKESSELSMPKSKMSLQKWEQMRAVVSCEDLALLIYGHVFQFSTEELSKALNISEGTIRYRIRNSLIQLASISVGGYSNFQTHSGEKKNSLNLIKGRGLCE